MNTARSTFDRKAQREAAPPVVASATPSAILAEVEDLRRDVRALLKHVECQNELVEVLLDRLTDATHLTVVETAKFLGVSVDSIRRRQRAGVLRLEQIPGTSRRGYPRSQVAQLWLDARVVAKAAARQKAEGVK